MAQEAAKRSKKSPAQKATEALNVQTRRVASLEKKHKALLSEAAALEPEIDAAKKRRDYLAQNPDLPPARDDTRANPAG